MVDFSGFSRIFCLGRCINVERVQSKMVDFIEKRIAPRERAANFGLECIFKNLRKSCFVGVILNGVIKLRVVQTQYQIYDI